MSAAGITDVIVAALGGGVYDVIVANYANPDMVGHTGSWEATIQGLEVVDACLGRVADAMTAIEATDPAGPGALLAITADHGNADELRDGEGNRVTAHSLNPVPFLLAGRAVDGRHLVDGVLADVAPTLLELAGLPAWPEVTGCSLLQD
jgi:2,3-bisphosphoglycerate-independent phosphoglycerate mutase